MAVINTNVQSLNAQRNLSASQSQLSTSMQRLSSGLRINSAKDDAAGLAISERMSTQIRGLNQAARNANDGVSLAQTAEGALGTIGNNLQRIRELAVQSRNATNSSDDRAALQKEVSQLKGEIGRVANQTAFNGTKLLDGSFTSQAFQVGANQGQTINIAAIANANIDQLGTWTTPSSAAMTGAAASAFTAVTAGDIKINGINIGAVAAGGAAPAQGANVAAAINAMSVETGVTATADSGGLVTLTSANAFTLALSGTATTATTGLTAGSATVTPGTAQTGFLNLDISTTAGADNAILAMDAALKAVNSSRADLGAVQNRFSSVVENLATTTENLSASRSRIMDADFAAETANLSRAQILQQAGTAMVAQANQLPQGVLSLLR
ncbi:flagellin [Acidovorax temperans]|uniref:Flagellin n=1 Tax=Acidovorax temperans TaxID=80878 RepID=A0A543L8I9_9BURK|nr:flagellin [Acidovorax temperans]TQN03635.1 flagellin [Acidovorax temperans]